MTLDFINSVIGKPWVSGSDGPESFDCWGLVKEVYRRFYGIELSGHELQDAQNLADSIKFAKREVCGGSWTETKRPETGDAVILSSHHVGIFFAPGRMVLHAIAKSGVVFQSIPSLKLNGFTDFRYYRHGNRNLC